MARTTNYTPTFGQITSDSSIQSLQKAKPREGLTAVAGLCPSENVCEAVTNFGSPESDIHLLQNIQEPVNEKTGSSNFVVTENQAALLEVISPDRLGTYMLAAGHNMNRALEFYIWNARLGGAFHLPIQAVEVGLRNRVNHALSAQFGPDWWKAPEFQRIIDVEREADLRQVFQRIRNRKLELATGQVVAGLSFGFWVGLLAGPYNPPIWGKHLRTSFPHFPPTRARKSLYNSAQAVATLRNRISHHEPLIKRNISGDYANILTLLEWICPSKLAWVKEHCLVPDVLRSKP